MTPTRCTRLTFADLTDYAAGEMTETQVAALEDHLFVCGDCGARAADVDALIRGLGRAARAGELEGFVTDSILNRLSRDGVHVRAFTLSPGAVVPCAVWDDDEVMALRLRGDFEGASELTLVQSAKGTEVARASSEIVSGEGEVIFATPASTVRQLPEIELDLVLLARIDGEERTVGQYKLVHGGSLRR